MLQNNVPDGTFVDAVAKLVQPIVTKITLPNGDLLVVVGQESEVYENTHLPEITALKLTTLTGIVNTYEHLMGSDSTEVAKKAAAIHVKSPTEVDIVVPFYGPHTENRTYAASTPVLPKLRFNEFMGSEEFLIMLMSGFVYTPERVGLQQDAGSLKAGIVGEVNDDGVSQTVTTKKGITRQGETKIDGPVTLQPFRTFSEIEQPESHYLFRLHTTTTQNDVPVATLALIEADGGAWRAAAITAIGDWLREKLPGATILS